MDIWYLLGVIFIAALVIGLIALMQKLQKRKIKYWNDGKDPDDE
jgi:hypothetical protein